jgi:DNA-binding CsgD family transcriptional regulator
MWPEAFALARAVSVLDTDAELRHAAALAELDLPAAQNATDALTAAHILAPGRPLRFAHPIMRQAVYEDQPHGRRAGDHARAARLLDSEGGDPDRAAVHLLAAEPAGDAWALDRLRASAGRALARGAPEAAAALMRRALAEPPAQDERAATLLELGRAERLAGETDAVEHLRQALAQASNAAFQADAARELATALATRARPDDAVELLEGAIARAPDRETALLLEAHLFGLSQASDELAARVASRLETVCEGVLGDTPGERLALAANVFHRTFLGLGSGDEVAALARRAWGEGRLLREATGDHFALYGPLIALRDSDHHDAVRPMFEDAIADARARGSAAAVALTLSTLARLEQLQGNLVDAEAAGRSALEAAGSSTHYRLILPLALSGLILPLLERGRLDAADDVLAAYGLAAGPPPPTTTGNPFLAARAKLRLAQGRVGDAVDDTNVWLERQRLRGGLNAVGASSILNPALPFLAAGDKATAETLAEEMLAVAKRWGVAGHTGSCLLALGLVTGGARAIEQFRQAVALLEQSPRRLEHAHALVELGAALRRANKRADAREALRAGMELAYRCGALPLAERARQELRATGARPRRLVLSGLDSLTAQERRVAEMAADGLSNPEIAQALFVTRRTIETHLGHVYQKLDLASRDQLAAALPRRRDDRGSRDSVISGHPSATAVDPA